MNIRIWIFCITLLAIFAPCGFAADDESMSHVVIVLDGSGSMDEMMSPTPVKKMDAAKESLLRVMKSLDNDTQVGLLVFSASASDPWVYPLGSLDMERITAAIDDIQPGGNTPLGEFIKMAADRLLEERKLRFGYGTYKLLIVTDGEAQDQHLVDEYTPDVISRGITVDVIGVAMKSDHTLATRVHSYRRADDPGELAEAIKEVFAEVNVNKKDVDSEDVFKEIAAIPDGMAAPLIKALSASGNQPIGETADSDLDRPLIDPAANTGDPPSSSTEPAPIPEKENTLENTLWGIGVIGFIVLTIVLRIKLQPKQNRPRKRYGK